MPTARALFVATMACLACLVTPAGAEPGWYAPRITTDPATGLPQQLSCRQVGAPKLLAAPATLALREGQHELRSDSLRAAGPGRWQADWADRRLSLTLASPDGPLPSLDLTVENRGEQTRTILATLSLPLAPTAANLFVPAGETPRLQLHPDGVARRYGYQTSGTPAAMPLGQVYDTAGDWGLACFGQFGELVESLGLEFSRTAGATTLAATLSFPCPAGGKVSRRLYLAATRGCWRPALGAVLACFPKVFEPQNPAVEALHGPFVCSGGTPPDASIANWYAQGCRVVEIHGTAPFYGEYVPTTPKWTVFCDDQWHFLKQRLPADQRPRDDASWTEIRTFVEKHAPPNTTVAGVNDYIDRLHRLGLKGLIYFNPTEAWAPWAAERFPADRMMAPDGKPYPAWYESAAMIPDRHRPWGKYLLEQLRGQLRIFPKVDGVFFDQSAGGGHDLTELCAEGVRLVRANGGICWWNGPYNVELAALADGMMTEGGGSETYRAPSRMIQYYSLAGKPIISLGQAEHSGYAEMLARGVIPQPVGTGQQEMAQRWFPLFRRLHHRRWVLDAHALDTDPRVDGNLYRARDGNLVVTLVPEPLPPEAAPTLFELPVTVRQADAAQVQRVYLLAPDLMGYHLLPHERRGDTIRVTVPRLAHAALLVLAKTGVYSALAGPLHLVQGAAGTVAWQVANLTRSPQQVTVAGQPRELAPGATVEQPLAVAAQTATRTAVPVPARQGDTVLSERAEVWCDPALLLRVSGPTEVRDDEPVTVRAELMSHLPQQTTARLSLDSPAVQFTPPATEAPLAADRRTTLTFAGRPRRAGRATMRIRAEVAGQPANEQSLEVEVLATAVAPGGLERVRAAELVFDVFGVDGGPYAHKPVSINGQEIGAVPQGSGDTWAPARALRLTPAALRALREDNQISIDNAVGDSFKVRNLRLKLQMRGGITVVSSVDGDTYTGGADWAHAEGHKFTAGQPLTGMSCRVRIDPRREEVYEEFFGTPASGQLVLEVNGADAGAYAHKPVTINGCLLGDLPPTGEWTERSLELTKAALDALMARNELVIENSNPPDAFKVRRARLEMTNTAGQKWVSDVDAGPYTSVGWEFAEGKVGSPIRMVLRFVKR